MKNRGPSFMMEGLLEKFAESSGEEKSSREEGPKTYNLEALLWENDASF